METEYKIKGLIFARSWWEAAVKVLPAEERILFYEAVFQYAFEGRMVGSGKREISAMFEMVRPFIDQDKIKYQERCERNRANARGRQRVAASGTQSLPVADNTNTNTTTNTNTNTSTISLTPEKEKFLVCGLFYARGSIKPAEELQKFWSYYESLGWKNNKGAQIVRKSSAARMWSLQSGVTENALAPRLAWYQEISSCECTDIRVFDNLVNLVVDGDTLHIYARSVKEFARICESQCLAGVQRYAAAYSCSRVIYESAGA